MTATSLDRAWIQTLNDRTTALSTDIEWIEPSPGELEFLSRQVKILKDSPLSPEDQTMLQATIDNLNRVLQHYQPSSPCIIHTLEEPKTFGQEERPVPSLPGSKNQYKGTFYGLLCSTRSIRQRSSYDLTFCTLKGLFYLWREVEQNHVLEAWGPRTTLFIDQTMKNGLMKAQAFRRSSCTPEVRTILQQFPEFTCEREILFSDSNLKTQVDQINQLMSDTKNLNGALCMLTMEGGDRLPLFLLFDGRKELLYIGFTEKSLVDQEAAAIEVISPRDLYDTIQWPEDKKTESCSLILLKKK